MVSLTNCWKLYLDQLWSENLLGGGGGGGWGGRLQSLGQAYFCCGLSLQEPHKVLRVRTSYVRNLM